MICSLLDLKKFKMNFSKIGLAVFTAACVFSINCEFVVNNRDVERSRRLSRSLSAEVVNSTTIALKWSEDGPVPTSSSSCPPNRLVVRVKTRGARRASTTREVDPAKQSVNIPGLLPDTTYSVRLTSVDCEGRQQQTKWVTVHTALSDQGEGSSNNGQAAPDPRLPGQPRKVTSQAFSDYVIISWEPPGDDVDVSGYVIGYGEGVPDVNWQYLEGHRRNVTVRNLKKSTQYVISVRAFNSIGKGPVVYDRVLTRDSPPPSSGSVAAPTDLRSKVLSHTTVWLQWTDPSLGPRHPHSPATDNRHYSVHYRTLASEGGRGGAGGDGRGGGGDRSVTVKELHVVLYNLHPATEYEFKVTMVKDGLTSAFSNVIVNRTLETTPFSPPRSVTITRLTSDPSTVVASWRPPKQPNGNITEYTVFYTQTVDLPSDRWLTAVARQRTDLALQGLAENATYYFRVEARNSVGPGPKSDIVKFDGRTVPVVAQGATNSPSPANSYHVIAFNETEEDEYEYTDSDKDEDTKADKKTDNIRSASLVHTDSASAVKTKREPNLFPPPPPPMTPPMTSDPDPQRHHHHHHQQQPLLVRFHTVLSHRISAYITWPETIGCPSQGVAGYRLRYRRSGAEGAVYVARGLADNVALLDNLAPNAKYVYQVQYLMENGSETPWSLEQELDTGAGL